PQLPSSAVMMQPTEGKAGRQVARNFLKRAKRDIGPATSASAVQAGRRGGVTISPPVRSLLMRKAWTLLIFIRPLSAYRGGAPWPPAPARARRYWRLRRAHKR